MGKRKRTPDAHNNKPSQNSPSSETMPCSSGAKLLSREKSSHLLNSTELRHSPGMDTNDTMKLLNMHTSLAHQHFNLGHSLILKRSRHYYGHQYSRRNSSNHTNSSISHGKTALLCDEVQPFKFASQAGSKSGNLADNRVKAFNRPGRIRLSSLVMDAVSSGAVKMVCGLCQNSLRQKPCVVEDAHSSGEISVVAVLVCGHVYHADCLEGGTSLEDIRDPPCPLCLSMNSPNDSSVGQK